MWGAAEVALWELDAGGLKATSGGGGRTGARGKGKRCNWTWGTTSSVRSVRRMRLARYLLVGWHTVSYFSGILFLVLE